MGARRAACFGLALVGACAGSGAEDRAPHATRRHASAAARAGAIAAHVAKSHAASGDALDPGVAGGASPTEPDAAAQVELELRAVAASGSVGLDWTAVEGAIGYRVYATTAAGAPAAQAAPIEVERPSFVHRGLENGTPHRYAVAALMPEGEGARSNEVQVTPGGEWVLEELGTGLFDDVASGAFAPRVPLDDRVHVLLFAEGYTPADLALLHDPAGHDLARDNDVDRFVDQVFAIEPYSLFREAFVIWVLPRASRERIGGDTAFELPVSSDRDLPVVKAVPTEGATAVAAWAALDAHPIPPTRFYPNYNLRARNHLAYFLLFDPERGRAGVSGRASGLHDPRTGRRISAAFGSPFAHEFTHAFGQLSDEYMDRERKSGRDFGPTWNVVGTNRCADLPWKHLLAGSAINPGVEQLVGAFGAAGLGYHSELLCLMNGHHDNAEFYGGTGDLRSDQRLCNFCREMVVFRVLERASVLPDTLSSFDAWEGALRAPFYRRFGFAVPELVPQTNDFGEARYQACIE